MATQSESNRLGLSRVFPATGDPPRWAALLKHKELIATIILAIHLYVDWYLGLAFSAQILAVGFLVLCYRYQSATVLWRKPYALWLWLLWLVLALLPAVRGFSMKDSLYYYINVLINAFILFWLGLHVVQNARGARRLFQFLAFFAALLAVHTIIEARTGILLFKTNRYDTSITSLLHFELGTSGIYRAEAFVLNPDSNGAFFAFMLMLPLGLLLETSSLRAKALYAGEMLLMVLALLFTYSTGAWLAAAVGVIFFLCFAGRTRYRVQIAAFILVSAAVLVVGFSHQLGQLLRHASASSEWTLRVGVWQTALRVIAAFPLLGIGLGRYDYIVRATHYRVPAQFIPVYHPHNSYLEMAALGGIPLALLFIALLALAFWHAARNWFQADLGNRAIQGGGLAAILSLSFYSLSNAGWTLTPLLAFGWLMLGALASPSLRHGRNEGNATSDGVQQTAFTATSKHNTIELKPGTQRPETHEAEERGIHVRSDE